MARILENLNLDDDFLFAKVMSDHTICKKVLEKILNIKIKNLTMPTPQKVIDNLLDSKSVRLDIYVNDDKGTIYNVEMQKADQKNLAKRSRYYQGSIDLDLISKGEDYNLLKKSFVIFICTFDPFNKSRHLYTFENKCIEDSDLFLNDEATKVFLNTKGTLNDVDDEMKEFVAYIENSSDVCANQSNSQLVKELNKKVKAIKENQSMEVEYMTLLERDKQKFQAGKIEGKIEGKVEFAKSLLDLLDDQTIAERSQLPLEMIKSLREEGIHS